MCAQLPHSITGGDWWPYQDADQEVMKYLTTIAIAAADIPEDNHLWIAKDEGEWATIRTVKRVAGRVATVKETPRNAGMKSSVAHQMVMYDALYGSKSNVSFSDENYEAKEMLKSDTCSSSIEEE